MTKKHLSGIDRLLIDATWVLQDQEAFDRNAALGVALSEFPLLADFWGYLLFVEGKAVAMIEMEEDRCGSERNRIDQSMPQKHLARWDKFLVYRYESTDDRIYFRDLRAQDLRWYPLLAFHRPETLYEWVRQPGGGISTYMRISDLVGVATDIPAIQAKGHKSAYREAMTKKYRR